MTTGFVFHEHYLWHDCGPAAVYVPAGGLVQPGEHVESPETKRRLRNLLEVAGVLGQCTAIPPVYAQDEDLLRFHTKDYLARAKEISANGGGDAGEFALMAGGGYDIAALAAGGAMALTDAVVAGQVSNGYALVRPPGHHAEADRGRGFCILGNLAVAAFRALETQGIERIVTVDWDVHHGNGTQWAFYEDPRVTTISIHQDGLYPLESGALSETGSGRGEGSNINVPLPAGSGHGAYMAVMERVVLPAIERVKPDLIMVSSGYDSCAVDPLGRMMLHSESYRLMTRALLAAARNFSEGRLVVLHEGGYSSGYVPFCGLAVVEELLGMEAPKEDPFLPLVQDYPGQELQPHQDEVIAEAAALATGRA